MLFCVCEHLSSDLDLSQVFYGIGKARRFEEYIDMAAFSPSRLRETLAEISLDLTKKDSGKSDKTNKIHETFLYQVKSKLGSNFRLCLNPKLNPNPST